MVYKQIGAKIAYFRSLRGFTQAELAKRMNISESTLSRLERGRYNSNVSISILIDVSTALHINISELTTFSDQERSFWYEE